MAANEQELKVFISGRDSTCGECNEELGRSAWITLAEAQGALCLSCSDLAHLAFLPTGSAALTRRAKKYSTLWAVVLKWSRARKRYERQGLLVEEAALQRAEDECSKDEDERAAARARAAERRTALDSEYVVRFARRIRELFANCPPNREAAIAEHACQKYSNRVGRSADAKAFDEDAVRLAVIAHVRHVETGYDGLLVQGVPREEARRRVAGEVESTLRAWSLS